MLVFLSKYLFNLKLHSILKVKWVLNAIMLTLQKSDFGNQGVKFKVVMSI